MKHFPSFVFLVIILVLAPSSRAALEKELGQALAYLRVTDSHDDAALTVDTIQRRPALVLDLRSLPVANGLAEAVQAALAVVLAAGLRRMGQQHFQERPPRR